MTEAEARTSWEAQGYTVKGVCSECGWGFVVRKEGWSRWVCTNYGQCEASVG
jgi:ssDNA-binding Zn-finger/Zn-ribbon topoisomerase 1